MDSRSGLMLEGLSRIVEHNETYDCAMISRYITGGNIPRREQRKRHAKLLAKLKLWSSFFIISLKGRWKDREGRVRREESFFIVNKGTVHQGKPEVMDLEVFGRVVADLGVESDQDSVLIVPRGALSGKSRAYTIYMDSLYEKRYMGSARLGRITGDIFSRVSGRPFIFDEDYDGSVEILNVHYPASGMLEYMGYRNFSKKEWRDVPVSVLNGTSLEEWLDDRDGSVFLRYIRE